MDQHKLRRIGWKAFFEEQLEPGALAAAVVARVSSHLGSEVLLLGEAGEIRVPVQLAESAGEIAVGDWLLLERGYHRAMRRLDRQSALLRKAAGEEVKPQAIAVNIDTLLIVSSCNDDFNLSRIERYLALALQSGATPVVVLTKADQCEDADWLLEQTRQLHPGLSVQTLDARDPAQVAGLLAWCGPGQTVALLGSSGVGKSTLGNALGAGDLVTGGIREQDSKGRHTTTSRSLHLLPSGGVLVDNPGVRELQLPECADGISDLFADVLAVMAECRFRNCSHQGDAGCAVRAAIASGQLDERRYLNYVKLNEEQVRHARVLAERGERGPTGGKGGKGRGGPGRKRRGRGK